MIVIYWIGKNANDMIKFFKCLIFAWRHRHDVEDVNDQILFGESTCVKRGEKLPNDRTHRPLIWGPGYMTERRWRELIATAYDLMHLNPHRPDMDGYRLSHQCLRDCLLQMHHYNGEVFDETLQAWQDYVEDVRKGVVAFNSTQRYGQWVPAIPASLKKWRKR